MKPAHCTDPSGHCACEHVIELPWAPWYWTETVLINNNHYAVAHPIHQHGGWYWVVGEDKFDYHKININRTIIMRKDKNCAAKKDCLPRNLIKPPAKDTIQVPPNGYVIIRTPLGNAGTWIFHCHINFHVDIGMALVLQIGSLGKPLSQRQGWSTGPLTRNEPCLTQPLSPNGSPKFISWFLGMDKNQIRYIEPGSDLVFSWNRKDHNVNEITEELYNSCNFSLNGTNTKGLPYNRAERGDYIWTAPALPQGKTIETYFFACGRHEGYHCNHGMKLKVFVKKNCPY